MKDGGDVILFEGDDASQLVNLLGKLREEKSNPDRRYVKSIKARTVSRVAARDLTGLGTGLAIPVGSESFSNPPAMQIANRECEWVGRDNEIILEREEMNGRWLITSGAQRCIPNPCPRVIQSIQFQRSRSLREILRATNGDVTGFGAPDVTYQINKTILDVLPVSDAPWQEWNEGCTNVATRNVIETTSGGPECVVRHARPIRDFQFAIELPGTEPTIENPDGIVAAVFELVQCTPITARLFLQEEILGDYNETQIFVWDDERYIVSTMTWRYKCTPINLNFAPGGACRTPSEIAAAVQTQIRSLGTTHPELATAVVTVDMIEKAVCTPLVEESGSRTEPDTCRQRNISIDWTFTIWGRIYRLEAIGSQIRFSVWEYTTFTTVRRFEGCNVIPGIFIDTDCCMGATWQGYETVQESSGGGWSQIYTRTIDCNEASPVVDRVLNRDYPFVIANPLGVSPTFLPVQERNQVNCLRLTFTDQFQWVNQLTFPAIVKPASSGVERLDIGAIKLKVGSWTATLNFADPEPDTFPVFTALPFGDFSRKLRSRITGGRFAPDGGWQFSLDCVAPSDTCQYRINAGIDHEPLVRSHAGIDQPVAFVAGLVQTGAVDGLNTYTVAHGLALEGTIRLYRCNDGWSIRGLLRWALFSRRWLTNNELQLLHLRDDIWNFGRFDNPASYYNLWLPEYNINQPVDHSNFWDEFSLSPLRQWPVSMNSDGTFTYADAAASFQLVPRV